MQRSLWAILLGCLLSVAGMAAPMPRALSPQEYTSCTCGTAPGNPGYCRFTGVKRADGSMHFEDRKSFARNGGCDFQTCGRLFYRDYGPKCQGYIPERMTLASSEKTPPTPHLVCTCGAAPEGCRLIALERADGKTVVATRDKPQGGACDSATCGNLFYKDFLSTCETYLPGPEVLRESDPELPQKTRESE